MHKEWTITKEKFLTVRWTNWLTLRLGLPAAIYVYWAFSSGAWRTMGGMIGISIIGVHYRLVLEGNTSMRFAWLRENSADYASVQQAFMHPLALTRKVTNLVFWIFLVPFFTTMEYSTGFIVFTVIIAIWLVLNLYTNNILYLTPEQYESYSFRIP